MGRRQSAEVRVRAQRGRSLSALTRATRSEPTDLMPLAGRPLAADELTPRTMAAEDENVKVAARAAPEVCLVQKDDRKILHVEIFLPEPQRVFLGRLLEPAFSEFFEHPVRRGRNVIELDKLDIRFAGFRLHAKLRRVDESPCNSADVIVFARGEQLLLRAAVAE